MPRALRIEYPGAIYHVLSRGDRREEIFRDDEDRARFVSALQQTCESVRGGGVAEKLLKRIRRGWSFGREDFVEWLLDAAVVSPQEGHGRAEHEEIEQEKAESIVRAELALAGWTDGDLLGVPKGHPGKVVIASRLRKETVVTLKWIANRLHMGTWTHVTNRLYHAAKPPNCVNT
jgi:hypothetical protein